MHELDQARQTFSMCIDTNTGGGGIPGPRPARDPACEEAESARQAKAELDANAMTTMNRKRAEKASRKQELERRQQRQQAQIQRATTDDVQH